MFTKEEIKHIAESTLTSQTVFGVLAKRERYRKETNLTKLHNQLMNQGFSIVEEDYINTFRSLEEKGAGVLIFGRKGKPNRFKWNYNLKGVAKMAKGEETDIQSIKKGPGRPQGSTNIMKRPVGRPRKEVTPQSTIKLILEIPSNGLTKELSELLSRVNEFKKAV